MEVQSDTTNTTETNTTFRGRVKWFNSTRGYGFITNLDKDEDTFVHHSGITPTVECWKTLTPENMLNTVLIPMMMVKVKLQVLLVLLGGPLLCETNTSRQSREGSDNDERRSGRIQRRNAARHTDSSTEETQTTQ